MKIKTKTIIIAMIIISILVYILTTFLYKYNDLKNAQAKAVESVERTSIENVRSECINRQQEESKRKAFVKALEEQERKQEQEQAEKAAQEEQVSAKSFNSETDTDPEPEISSTVLPNQAAFNNYISMVPVNVMNHLYSDGWTLTLVSDEEVANIAANRGMSVEGQIGAMAMSDTKQIVVANRCPEKVIHEIGHAMMYMYTPYIVTKVIDTCNAEKDAYIATFAPEPHNVSTTEEILAEAYIQYILNGSTLQANCPGIYQILAEQTNRM